MTLTQALLSAEGPDEDNDFTIKAADGTSPEEFRTMYGSDSHTITLSGTLTARNLEQYNTQAVNFDLTLTYDDSPQFGEPAVYESNNKWKVEDPYEIYEGSTSLPDLSIPWTAFSNGERAWSAGTPTAMTFQCYDQGLIRPAQWPADGEKDSEFFTVASATAATSSNATATFKIAPDYEEPDDDEGSKPSDNTYQLRLVARHQLHQTVADEPATGCDGSSVDVIVKVKDVGTPAPLEITGQYQATDNTKITFAWTAPTGFIEDGKTVPFPHPSFEPTAYQFRHRPASTDQWTEIANGVGPNVGTGVITEVPGASHQIQGRATNSEGTSPWPTTWKTVNRAPEPDQVSKPSAQSITTSAITIRWTTPSSNGTPINGYNVQYKEHSDTQWTNATHAGTLTNATVSNLEPDTPYDFQVQAISDAGNGLWSPALETRTAEIIVLPVATISATNNTIQEGESAEFTVTLNKNDNTTVNLSYSWTGNNGSISSGTISFSASTTETISIPTTENSDNVDGSLTVTVSNGTGYSVGNPNSATVTITHTLTPPSKPDTPTIDPRSTTSLAVNWQEPTSQGPINSYQIQYRETGTQEWTEIIHGSSSTTKNLNGLTVNTSYDVQVQATNADRKQPVV